MRDGADGKVRLLGQEIDASRIQASSRARRGGDGAGLELPDAAEDPDEATLADATGSHDQQVLAWFDQEGELAHEGVGARDLIADVLELHTVIRDGEGCCAI